jgi:hypothetical protein
MAERQVATLEQIVSLARQLPPVEKIRLIEPMVPEIERDMLSQRPARRKSLLGLCADLGPAPSDEDVVEIRRDRKAILHNWERYEHLAEELRRAWPADLSTQDVIESIRR